jgi:hypothetical protein
MENEKPDYKTPEEIEKLKKKNKKSKSKGAESEANPESEIVDKVPKISREHDFTHTHPTHAHHKTFGVDHEPGAF